MGIEIATRHASRAITSAGTQYSIRFSARYFTLAKEKLAMFISSLIPNTATAQKGSTSSCPQIVSCFCQRRTERAHKQALSMPSTATQLKITLCPPWSVISRFGDRATSTATLASACIIAPHRGHGRSLPDLLASLCCWKIAIHSQTSVTSIAAKQTTSGSIRAVSLAIRLRLLTTTFSTFMLSPSWAVRSRRRPDILPDSCPE